MGLPISASALEALLTSALALQVYEPTAGSCDQARIEASVEVESFTFTFTSGAGTTLCEHTGTMTA
jgi:hypothetical protein